MRTRVYMALVLSFMVVLAASYAWGAVTVTWTDGLGPHTSVIASTAPNPAYDPDDPLTQEEEFIWILNANVTYNDVNPISFRASGNWTGELGLIWDQLRVIQSVNNNSSRTWTDFHQDIVDQDGEFYNIISFKSGWNASLDGAQTNFVASSPAYYLPPNTTPLPVGVHVWANITSFTTGEGSVTFSEYPTYLVPEAGSVAAVLGGGSGLLVFLRRRKK